MDSKTVAKEMKMKKDRPKYKNLHTQNSSNRSGIFKKLSSALFVGCLIFGAQTSYAADDPKPTLDTLHDSLVNIPGTSEVYPESAYTLTEVTPADHNNLAPNVIEYKSSSDSTASKYYEINLKYPVYGEGSNTKYFKWSKDITGVYLKETTDPSEAVLTLKYNPDDAIAPIFYEGSEPLSSVNKIYVAQDIQKAINAKTSITSVSSKFAGNTMNISGTNYDYSAVMSGANGTINNVSSSFIGNNVVVEQDRTTAVYGALVKSLGTMDNVYSEFIGNTVSAYGARITGGLIEAPQAGIIKNLTVDAIANKATSENSNIEGAVIGNSGTITNITGGMYMKNSAASHHGNVYGGAIYNDGIIGTISDTIFSDNFARSETGTAQGGALYNIRDIDSITNTIFINNYAQGTSAQGGAIFTDANLKIYANNGKRTEFTGNYVINNGTKENQAIYINDRNATLTLSATDNGTILFNDAISGVNGYNVVLAGDTTGSIALYNSISNANVSAANVNVNLANNNTFDYNFLSLDSSETAKYSLDIDFANSKADNFTLGSASRGTIYVNDLNIIGSTPTTGKIIQIIKGPDTISLALAESLLTTKVTEANRTVTTDTITANTNWGTEFAEHVNANIITEGIRTAITGADRTTADSIEYYYENIRKEIETNSLGDTLALMNSLNVHGEKYFRAVNAEDVYVVGENLGQMVGSTDSARYFRIIGKKDGDVLSTLDANGHTLFETTNNHLNLANLNIINLASSDGSLINNGEEGCVLLAGNINVSGQAGSNAIINNGTLQLNNGSIISSNVNILGDGTLELQNSARLTLTDGASISQGTTKLNVNNSLRLDSGTLSGNLVILNGRVYLRAEGVNFDSFTGNGIWSQVRLTGGTLTHEIMKTGTTDGLVVIDGDITLNAPIYQQMTIAQGGSLTTNADYLCNDMIWNRDISGGERPLYLTGGTVSHRLDPTVANIIGDVTYKDGIEAYNNVLITETGTLTTNASNFKSGTITNNNKLTLTGGTLANNKHISGTGVTEIAGNVTTNANLGSTGGIHILEDAVLNTNADRIKVSVVNDNVLRLTIGSLTQTVTGNGYINIAGNVYYNLDTSQDILVDEGAKLYINPNRVLTTITNNGQVVLNGNNQTLTQSIKGNGNLYINNNTTLEAYIENSITVGQNRNLISNADNFCTAIENRGTTTLTGGTVKYQIAGQTSHTGTVYIGNGDVRNYDVISEALIDTYNMTIRRNSSLTIDAGNLEIGNYLYNSGTLNLTGEGKLTSRIDYGGTLNIFGDVTGNEFVMNNIIFVKDGGSFTVDAGMFHKDRTVTNDGSLYLSGVLTKNIAGNGTTYIDGELGLTTNAAIQGTLNLNNGILKTDSSLINNYKLGKTTGSGELMFNIDFAKSGMKNDCLTLNSASDAIFTVSADKINFVNVPSTGISDAVYQVLFGGSSSQLQLGDNTQLNIKIVNDKVDVLDRSDVYYDEDFKRIHQEGIVQGTLSLDTTQTTNDSVKLNIGETIWDDPVTQREPLLAAWNKLITPEERFFRFREADNLYTGLQDMGPTSAGKLNIIGVLNEETGQRSKISLGGKTGFELSNDRILNIYDTEITNVSEYAIKMNGGQVGYLDADGNIEGGLVGVVFSDNTHSSTDTTTSYASVLNISGNSSIIYQIKDSKFINNSNIKSNSDVNANPSAVAGAIYLEYGSIGTKDTFEGGIINSTFEGNHIIGTGRTNQAKGGAISVETNSVISNIKDSTFKGNYIEGFNGDIIGGALFVQNQTTVHNIENTLFEGNYLEKAEGLSGARRGGALYNNGTIDILYNVTFKDNRAAQGSALYNTGTITEITESLFEGNSASNGGGGAIFNSRNIGSITHTDFIGNIATSSNSAAIYNTDNNARIGTIADCIFDGNKISATSEINGAVISNWNNATIDSINNITVKNNVVEANRRVWGLVTNGGTLNSITNSTFSNNTVNNEIRGILSLRGNKAVQNLSGLKFENNISAGNTYGGAVYNTSTIESFTNSQFIGNKVTNATTTGGGAVENAGTIKEFRDMLFEGNGLISDTSFYNHRWSSGGAIYNEGTFTNGIVNSVFRNNYALMGEGGGMERARGGAIFTSKDLRIAAEGEGGLTEFTGNYIGRPNNEDTYLYEAIHVNDKKTLTIDANTGGRILLNDYINGASGYNVVLTGDSDGRISLYNAIKNANVTASSTNIDTADGKIFDYDFLSLNSQDSAGYSIDIDFKNSVADNFTVGENSQGIITIKDLNVLEEADKITTVQIIKAGDSALQLALDSEKINVVDNILLTLNNRVFNTDIFHQNKGFALGTTDTTNDSITMMVDTTYDNLNIIGASTVNADRQFIFNNDETYTVSTDLDNIAAGVFAVKGLEGDQTSATIDANGHSLFNLSNATELQITNTKLTNSASDALQNLITINNEAASVNLKNAYIDGNITGNNQFAININGAGKTVISGTIDHADTTLSSGTLTFAQNTFADSNDSLTVNNGNVSLTDSAAKDYQVNKLNSASDASYAIDLDLAAERADKIILTDNTSEGVVKISDINFVNKLDEDKNSFVVQVLDTNHNDKIALELDKFVQTRYDIEDISRIENDEVQQITHFSDKFNSYKRDGVLYGDLYLTTIGTENDSIAFEIKEDWENSKELIGSRGDTLRLVNMSELENRTFVSDLATDVYNATDNLGQTHAGTLTINGTEEGDEKSTINLRRHTGFELGANTTLNMNNVQISGNNGVIKVTDDSAEINLNNTNISGNITGTTEYHINVSGTGTTNLSGLVENGYTTLTKGGLSFDKDTFNQSGSTLDVQSGSVYMNDGNIQTYNFANLVSTDKSKFSIDVDLENSVADGIRVDSGQGTIVLEEFNILGGLTNIDIDKDYTIKILHAPNSNIQLDLSEYVKSQIRNDIKLGTDHIILDTDEVVPDTLWTDKYWMTEQDLDIWGRLGLFSKDTDNDSLHLYHLSIKAGETKRVLGDTLKLWSQAELDEDRTFTFETANDRYEVSEYLGTTSAGKLSIIGVADEGNDKLSVIDMNRKTGFGLSNETELTLKNVEFENVSYRDGCVVNVSNPDAILNLDNVKILDTTSGNAITNAGTINMTGGKVVLDTGIVGSGVTNITGSDLIFGNNISITQQNINVTLGSLTMSDTGIINGKLSIDTDGTVSVRTESLTGSVNNKGNIILRGGELIQNIAGDGGKTTILGEIVNSAKIDQDVDIKNSGKLTSSAEKLGGEINNDGELVINGELSKFVTGAGTTYVNETLIMDKGSGMSGTLELNDGDISTRDNSTADYNIGSMQGSGSFTIDIDTQNLTADKFIVGNDSEGTVYIDSVNFLNIDGINENFKVQILDTDGTDALQLALNSEISSVDYKVKRTVRSEVDDVNAVTKYSDIYNKYLRGGDVFGNIVLGTTDTTNDSLVVSLDYSKTKWDETRETDGLLGDTLTLWNQLEADGDKKFYFDDVKTYKVGSEFETEGLGITKGENVSITGVSADETKKSTINLNNKTGFELAEATKFTLSDVKLTGNQTLIDVTNNDASIILQNAYIDGNITGSNSYKVEISGSDTTTLNGILNNADTELKSGTLKFNTDTFEAENNTLTTTAGNVALNDGQVKDYNINTLESNSDANYFIDVNLTDKVADTLHVTHGNGTVTLDKLNITGSADITNQDYKIRILYVDSDSLQLALSDNAQSELGNDEYLIGQSNSIIDDEIKSVTNWKDIYNRYSQDHFTYGKLSLTQTVTTNDSIGIHVTRIEDGELVFVENLGDTLRVVNNDETNETKTFKFDSSSDEYKVKEDLGQTKGTVNIEGVSDGEKSSIIDFDGHSGFELDENSKLNIKNTELSNAHGEQGSVINAPVPGKDIDLTNVKITNNSSDGEHGGAIYSNSNVNIHADNDTSVVSGNSSASSDEAIYMGEKTTLTLDSKNDGTIIINDKINGDSGYKVHVTGDNSSDVYLNNKVENGSLSLDTTTLHLSSDDNLKTSDVVINSGRLDLINNAAQQQVANSFYVNGTFTLDVDVDLANQIMDRLPENTHINPDAFINVDRINLLSDTELPSVSIPFAYKSFKDNVEYIGPNVLSKDTQVTTAFAPIFKYSLKYENRNDLGYFVFTRGAGADSSSSDAFNPAVLAAPVASQAGAFVAMNQALDYAFEHSDAYMLLPSDKRFLLSNSGRYAISSGEVLRNQPGDFINSAIWVNSYASFENIGLANGPKVSTTSYGTLVGGDSELKHLSHGWQTASTAYMGYNGSNQHFSGVSTYQNGGLLGVTQTFYKHNFFTALTATAGATVGEASTMYGHENFTSLMAGVASKSGYNLELRDGKYIIQPSMMMSYTYINTFDYTNAAGVRIDSDPLHTIQLHPDIKFAAKLKNGWQPYAKVGMVWNLMNDTKFTANDVRLPELSVKPYVEYGVGIQKRYADKFSGYIQAMIRNGGRNGIALTAGFRWSFGSEGKPIEHCKDIQNVAAKETCNPKNITPATAKTVQTKVTPTTVNTAKTKITPVTSTTVKTSPTRKIIKQLSYKPNVNHNSSKSTRTINKGMLKQL